MVSPKTGLRVSSFDGVAFLSSGVYNKCLNLFYSVRKKIASGPLFSQNHRKFLGVVIGM